MISLAGFQFVPNIFFPPSDKAIFTAEFQMPSGTSIECTEAVVREIEAFMARELRATPSAGSEVESASGAVQGATSDEVVRTEGITNWATFVGRGGPRFYLSYSPEPNSPDYAFAIVNATSRAVIDDELIPRLEAFCLQQFPELDVTLNPLQMGLPVIAPVQVRLSGRDADTLFDIVETLKANLRTLPGTKNISDDWGAQSKKLVVRVNQPRARRAGVTNQDIAISLQTALSGFVTTQFREEDEIIPVSLRSAEANRTDVTKMTSLNVYAQTPGVLFRSCRLPILKWSGRRPRCDDGTGSRRSPSRLRSTPARLRATSSRSCGPGSMGSGRDGDWVTSMSSAARKRRRSRQIRPLVNRCQPARSSSCSPTSSSTTPSCSSIGSRSTRTDWSRREP